MRTRPVLFRLSAALAFVGTSVAAANPAFAQSAPAAADPPARVGRLARLSGTVSFHTADQQEWQAATLNYPVTSGNSFWTEPGAAAQIEIGATHLALDQQTELDIDTLDNTQLAATEPQGGVYLNVRLVNPGETTTLRTPRGTVQIASVGRYEVVAGDTEQPTRVTVVQGAAQVTGPDGLSLSVGPHQTATINGSDHLDGSVGPEVDDPFLTAQLQAEQPAPTPAPAPVAANQLPAPPPYQPPPLVQQMTGAEDLSTVGNWTEAPQYGRVWYPPVDPDWVPYRNGHWAYVAPWGWTWVDDASWGFAPYHYGRWVQVDDRWGWVPVAPEAPIEVAPVYSPALVDFVGIAAGVAVGAAIGVGVGLALGGGGRGNVGWVPLGFHEPYIPPYGGSPGYINRINSPNFSRTQNIGTIVNQRRTFINNGTINRGNTTVINNYYSNAAGATLAPQQVMQRGQPVAASARPLTRQQFAQVAQPRLQPQVMPTGQTPGITPAVARQHNIPPAQLIRPAVAPGPALAARPPGQPSTRSLPLQPPGRATPAAAARPPLGAAPGGVSPPVPVPGPNPASAPHPGLPNLAPHGPAAEPVLPGSRPASVPPKVAGAPEPVARPGAPGPAIRPGAPGPAIRPGAPGPATPPGAPGATIRPGAAGPAIQPGAPGPANRPIAPGPAIPPRGQVGGPAAAGLAGAPPLAPHQTAPLSGLRPIPPIAAPAPHVAAPAVGHPAVPAGAAPAAPPRPAAAPAHVALPPPQVAHSAPPPVARPAPPPVARPAPPPVARPAPPPVAHFVPPPVARPVQPQFARPAPPPPPVMRPPPPVARPAPPPIMRPPPQMARPAPPPPPPHRVCPAGHPVC